MSEDWDEANDKAWFAEQKAKVEDYLESEGLVGYRVPQIPAWHVSPYVAIWAIESLAVPGNVGWWAISGDLPSDYCSSSSARNPRQAAKHFSETWLEAVRDPREDGSLGTTGISAELRDMMASRAQTLANFAAEDEIWHIAEDDWL